MKKALALVLALVLALSMAVSAFAANLVILEEVSTLSTVSKLDLEKNVLEYNGAKEVYLAPAKGGTYYFLLTVDGNYPKLYNVAASATGCASVEMVAFDPATMKTPAGLCWVITDGEQQAMIDASTDTFAFAEWQEDYNAQYAKTKKGFEAPQYKDAAGNVHTWAPYDYEYAVALAKYLSNGAEVSGKYTAKLVENDGTAAVLNVLKVVVEKNYTAAYKEGSFAVTATLDKAGKKAVEFEGDVISDVTIFEYEQVKWAAEEEDALVLNAKGYSDYETYLAGGYGEKYVVDNLRSVPDATVVSTTAFRAIEGKDLTVVLYEDADELAYVTVEGVAKAQKGVNFAFSALCEYDEAGLPAAKTLEPVDYIGFEFLGEQVIKSDYTIVYETGYTYYDLREAFDVKVEEDDILTYYVLKDGKVCQEIVVDYMTADIDAEVVLVLEGSNATLGSYEIRLDVESAAEVGEENPNTGAESVVGVVAALAVVSVATAAAVSLKK